jgi:spore germination cell wall hydrolase CwlJ-like protein
MPRQPALSREMECLAGAVYFEARGEPLAGQLAVAEVIINRSESGAFPSDYCGVVFQRSQFSFVRGGRMPTINRNSAAWTKAAAIARIAHEGLWGSAADKALYFHARSVHPGWSHSKVALTTINSHIFYR